MNMELLTEAEPGLSEWPETVIWFEEGHSNSPSPWGSESTDPEFLALLGFRTAPHERFHTYG